MNKLVEGFYRENRHFIGIHLPFKFNLEYDKQKDSTNILLGNDEQTWELINNSERIQEMIKTGEIRKFEIPQEYLHKIEHANKKGENLSSKYLILELIDKIKQRDFEVKEKFGFRKGIYSENDSGSRRVFFPYLMDIIECADTGEITVITNPNIISEEVLSLIKDKGKLAKKAFYCSNFQRVEIPLKLVRKIINCCNTSIGDNPKKTIERLLENPNSSNWSLKHSPDVERQLNGYASIILNQIAIKTTGPIPKSVYRLEFDSDPFDK